MIVRPTRWTKREDELFRELVEAGASLALISEALNRTEENLKRRGYLLGLPLKWFKRSAAKGSNLVPAD
jgi:hypothetical protein